MLKILLYGYTTGVRSSRAIERRCHDDVAFRFLAANQAPDHRSIARFRRRHLDAPGGVVRRGSAAAATATTTSTTGSRHSEAPFAVTDSRS